MANIDTEPGEGDVVPLLVAGEDRIEGAIGPTFEPSSVCIVAAPEHAPNFLIAGPDLDRGECLIGVGWVD
jgi:hypothetical protein